MGSYEEKAHVAPTKQELTFLLPQPVEQSPPPHVSPQAEPLTRAQVICNLTHCLVVAFTGFPLGWDVGTIGHLVTLLSLRRTFGVQPMRSALVVGTMVSIMNLGCICGAFFIGGRAHRMGSRYCIWLSLVCYWAGTVIELVAVLTRAHWAVFCCGRLLTGVFVGTLGVVGPVFISDTVKLPNRRKMCISWHQIWCCIGVLLGNVAIITNEDLPALALIVCGCQLIIVAAIDVAIAFVPEVAAIPSSPTSPFVSDKIRLSPTGVKQLVAVASGPQWHAHCKSAAVMALQQFTGINFFFYYSSTLFIGISPAVATAILSSVNCGASFFLGIVLERVGTRRTLFCGALGMAACMVFFTSFGLARNKLILSFNVDGVNVLIVAVYIVLFALSWGPGASVLVNEISTSSELMAMAVCTNWAANFVVAITTPAITAKIGYGVGFIFTFFLLAATVFVTVQSPKSF
jgi:SP family sugar:H+ symporter-like MFS transporter